MVGVGVDRSMGTSKTQKNQIDRRALIHAILFGKLTDAPHNLIIPHPNRLQAFKAEFEGGATAFVPVVAEEPGEEGAEGNAQPPSSGRVLKYAEGLAHRLVLLEEEG